MSDPGPTLEQARAYIAEHGDKCPWYSTFEYSYICENCGPTDGAGCPLREALDVINQAIPPTIER